MTNLRGNNKMQNKYFVIFEMKSKELILNLTDVASVACGDKRSLNWDKKLSDLRKYLYLLVKIGFES